MHELIIPATASRLHEAQAFAEEHMREAKFCTRTTGKILLAVEEVFVNIAHYAYPSGSGFITIRCKAEHGGGVMIEFLDRGVPYNPLLREAPDIHLPAESRGIGGLGLFLVQSLMDEVTYRYEDGRNILTLRKKEEG